MPPSKKIKISLVKKPRVQLPQTEVTRRRAKMDEDGKNWGISRLNRIMEELKASKEQSTSSNEGLNNCEPDWIDEDPEEVLELSGQESNCNDSPGSFSKYVSRDR